MSSEITEAKKTGLVTRNVIDTGGFTGDATDILIPRLLIGQSTSKAVQNEKVAFGQIFRSTTTEVVGGREKPVAIIPLAHSKTWVLSEKVAGKYTFRGSIPFVAENKDLPWNWTEKVDGKQTEWKRTASLNFYVLLPADIARDILARTDFQKTGDLPDTEASLLPCAVSFQSTSFKAGRTLITHFAKAADFGVKPYVSSFNLFTDKTSNDQGTFYVLRVEALGKTDPAFFDTCEKWRTIVGAAPIKVDEGEHAQDEPPHPAGGERFDV